MKEAYPLGKVPIEVSRLQLEESIDRARRQEGIYGHNTGHFTLKVEKENTVIGVLGEIVVRDWLNNLFDEGSIEARVKLSAYGSPYDLEISREESNHSVHVKTGLWKRWPSESWHFGIHSDQGIASSGAPVVLVSFIKTQQLWPRIGRIEGFIDSEKLSKAKIIRKGERFPSTGVLSRTDNLLTQFAEYVSIKELPNYLKIK
jgi:hypothetical protein